MHEVLLLVLSCAVGLALGAVFFAGLWWTVSRIQTTKHPVLLVLGSLLARTTLVIAGFYFVSDGQWQRWVACLLGFVSAKLLAKRLALPVEEASHAP